MRRFTFILATAVVFFSLSASAQARADLVELDAALKSAPAGWQRALLEELTGIYAQDPQAARALDELRGLDPAFYAQQRRPEPEVERELRVLLANGFAPALLIERAWRGLDRMDFSEGRAGAMERAQLRDGLYRAIARTGHPAADDFLALAAQTDDERGRGVALASLGWTRTPLAVDTLRAAVRGDDVTSAVIGLGAAQQATFLAELAADKVFVAETARRQTLAGALAMQRGSREAASALASLLVAETDATVVMNLVEALSRVAHADTRALLSGRSFASAAAERGAAQAVRRVERRRARGR